jgi:hypothetical protein
MSNEIQKWTPIENKLAELRRCQLARQQRETVQPSQGSSRSMLSGDASRGEVIELLRVCAVHDRPYLARYIKGADGRFHYAQSVKLSHQSYRDQYEDNPDGVEVHTSQLTGYESCAWCRADGEQLGQKIGVRCGGCGSVVCFGRTVSAGRYFYCRSSCGSEGQLPRQGISWSEQGNRPEIRGQEWKKKY